MRPSNFLFFFVPVLFFPRTPAFRVSLPSLLAEGDRTDSRADFDLFVALHGRFRRSTAFFTPNKTELCTDFAEFIIDDGQGQHGSFVVAIATERRESNHLSVLEHLVVRQRCVVRKRQVEGFVYIAL